MNGLSGSVKLESGRRQDYSMSVLRLVEGQGLVKVNSIVSQVAYSV